MPLPPVHEGRLSARLAYDRGVAYDEELAARIRALIGDEPSLTEQKMFGGLAFLIGRKASRPAAGRILVRADPRSPTSSSRTTSDRDGDARPRDARVYRVAAEDVRSDQELVNEVELGTGYARTLPAKQIAIRALRPVVDEGRVPRLAHAEVFELQRA